MFFLKSADDLNLWPLILTTISILPIGIMNICGKFHWNLSMAKETSRSQVFEMQMADDLDL